MSRATKAILIEKLQAANVELTGDEKLADLNALAEEHGLITKDEEAEDLRRFSVAAESGVVRPADDSLLKFGEELDLTDAECGEEPWARYIEGGFIVEKDSAPAAPPAPEQKAAPEAPAGPAGNGVRFHLAQLDPKLRDFTLEEHGENWREAADEFRAANGSRIREEQPL